MYTGQSCWVGWLIRTGIACSELTTTSVWNERIMRTLRVKFLYGSDNLTLLFDASIWIWHVMWLLHTFFSGNSVDFYFISFLVLIVFYLTALIISRFTQDWIVGWLLNKELERQWKERSWTDLSYAYLRYIRLVTGLMVQVNLSVCTPPRLVGMLS